MAISPENRKRFEQAGLDLIRADYFAGGRRVILPENRLQAREWMAEKETKNASRESVRNRLMLVLTGLATIGALIAAVPVVKSWISN